MKGFYLIVGILLSSILFFSLTVAQDEKGEAEKKIFTEQKCNSCHSIEVVGLKKRPNQKPPDLSEVGSEQKAEFLAKYLRKQETIGGAKHMVAFKGSDEELEKLTKWLESLKKK
ncbi:MAG: c-type cytochrome [Ignavibacteriales bacterium]|nr:c-type cytochrome [Ignavibacteriales bacterium]